MMLLSWKNRRETTLAGRLSWIVPLLLSVTGPSTALALAPRAAPTAKAPASAAKTPAPTPPAPAAVTTKPACSFDAPAVVEQEGEFKGRRRLALVVGVGKYKNAPKPPNLVGPPKDADRMYKLLTDPVEGMGFPKNNVCLLKDSDATLANFEKAFDQGLVKRAQDGDVVVVYFAGHGSQAKDGNLDEPDLQDETLLLYDSRTNGVPDLVDDKLNQLLGGLYKKMNGENAGKEQNVTVVLDSCNSGTATRGDENTTTQSRYFDTTKDTLDLRSGIPAASPTGAAWDGEDLPGLSFISAAVDGTPALEMNGEGVFTTALIQTLRDAGGTSLTYGQLQLRLNPLVAARRSPQKVQVQGSRPDLKVFGASTVQRPASYSVASRVDLTTKRLELKGTPLPGWSRGAQVRIYNLPGTQGPAATLADLKDPKKAKATGVVSEMKGVEGATVELLDKLDETSKARLESIHPGDIAVLYLPGKESVSIRVRLATGKPGGIPADRAQLITKALEENPDLKNTVVVSQPKDKFPEEWTLSLNSESKLQLFDPANNLRMTYDTRPKTPEEAAAVARNLGQQARQKALLQVQGEAGDDFKNDKTLQVQLVPVTKGNAKCAEAAPLWDSERYPAGTAEVELPLTVCYQVRVKLADDAKDIPLYVGGVLLSGDGSITGFPNPAKEQQFIVLRPGQTREYTFSMVKRAVPPINARDHLLVFGTREQVKWADLTEPAASRGTTSGLQGALAAYMGGGARGAADVEVSDANTWTSSHVSLVSVVNSGFVDSGSEQKTDKREFTLQHYDIREQLPANKDSA
ncbi:caspase family protein, partial [Archangium sp.]|uniref:caspase family protein n=1 Tax=Archangium sp. TaxID=1872627 RepID=UPI002ED85EDC